MAMNFTRSKDGIERADVRVTIRLSRDDLNAIKKAARSQKMPWRKFMEDAATGGVYRSTWNALEE